MTAEQLLKDILELRNEIEFNHQNWDTSISSSDKLLEKSSQLISYGSQLKERYPEIYQNCINESNLYAFLKPLEVLAQDLEKGYEKIIPLIKEKTDETVLNMIKHFQTNDFFRWAGSNPTAKVKEKSENASDRTLALRIGEYFLPKIKAEEMGDLLCLAFSGKLSSEYANINKISSDKDKTKYVQRVMANERVYLNWNFDNLKIEDRTGEYKRKGNGEIASPKGLAAPGIIDSSYLDKNKKTLYCTICTSDASTEKQGAQLFEIYHTLSESRKKGTLKLEGSENLNFNIMFFNRAFFCTQDENEVKSRVSGGRNGGSKEVDGYNAKTNRANFDKLVKGRNVTKDEMDKLNGLVTLSIIGNKDISFPRFPYTYDICDLIFCNPVTAGSSTLWMYEEFEKIKIFKQPERTQKFFNFLLDYSEDVINTLNKIEPSINKNESTEQNELIQQMKNSYERMLEGISKNFTSYNLGRSLTDIEIEKLKKIEEKIDVFNKNQPNTHINADAITVLYGGGVDNKGKKIKKNQEENKEDFLNKCKNQAKELNKNINVQDITTERQALSIILDTVNKLNKFSTSSFNPLYKKIDEITKQMYSPERKQVEKASISSYIKEAIQISKIMVDTGNYSLSSMVIDADLKKQFNFSGTFYSTFLKNGSKRLAFQSHLQKKSLAEAEKFIEADGLIVNFLNNLTSKEGLTNMIHKEGYDIMLENLVNNLEKILDKNIKPSKKM